MRPKFLAWLVGFRLQRILLLGFVLTTALTILVATPVTLGVINRYLAGARDERLGRDMKLAEAFYDLKAQDIATAAQRLASSATLREQLLPASRNDSRAVAAIDEQLTNEFTILAPDTHRFVVALDARGVAVGGVVASNSGRTGLVNTKTNWLQLPIVRSVLDGGLAQSGTEIVPADVLGWLGLAGQARIALVDTPKANPTPYDPREGTAGLVLLGVAPIRSPSGELIGAAVVGHLFNNDFTLVDRIKEVAGVDTATIFLGDQRVSTNVKNDAGDRAIGTRVSQEVYDVVLAKGQEFTGRAMVVNQWYDTRYQPLRDHLGRVVGSLYVGVEEASFVELVDSFRRWLFLIAGASIIVAVLIAIPVAWSISRPLADLAEATRKVSQGDWSVRVPVYGRGETGILAESFNTMVETLRDTQDQLVQKEKLASLGQLAAGVAHEINNPLGSVLLYADILCRETPPDNPQQRDDLSMIIREATRCKTIVTDLLNFSRQNEVLAQQTDLAALLGELVEEVSARPLYAGVKLQLNLDPALPAIEADPLQLRQVFLNLMNNAAEAMPMGGTLTLRGRRAANAGQVTIEVQDTGTGIGEENMKKLFTPFFTTKPIGKGTGLGLAITYGIVKMHQGQITVQSHPGQGTTFTITLRTRLPAREQRETLFH